MIINAIPNMAAYLAEFKEQCVAKFTNGPVIITESQTLDMTKYGLKAGDQVNVICIGGGGAGGAGAYYSSSKPGYAGGDAGCNGGNNGSYYGGAAGRGYGSGGGGGCASVSTSGYNTCSGGGGGSGYLAAKTVTLNSTQIAVTIGAGGKGAIKSAGGDGGTTYFGSLLSAAGGKGGAYTDSGSANSVAAGGTGGFNGGKGRGTGTHAGEAGGGAGGHIIESFIYQWGSDGTDGENIVASKTDYTPGGTPEASVTTGHGVVIFWY